MNNNTEKEASFFFSEKTGKYLSIGGIFFLVSALVVFISFGNWSFSSRLNEEKFGQFGDFVGGIVGSIFSLVGIILFYAALTEQRKDIKINQESARLQTEALEKQIEEFELQRSELEETRKVVKEQSETLRFQRFENTFFNLLSLHHQIVGGIDEIDRERDRSNSKIDKFFNRPPQEQINYITYSGRDVFKRGYERIISLISAKPEKHFIEAYLAVYERYQTDFGHYFRNLYRIIKFIDGTIFTESDEENYKIQYQYTSMVRGQLADYELLWLFYNCLSENGIEKFKPFVEKYCLFKNIPKDKIHDQKLIVQYTESAFYKKKPIC